MLDFIGMLTTGVAGVVIGIAATTWALGLYIRQLQATIDRITKDHKDALKDSPHA